MSLQDLSVELLCLIFQHCQFRDHLAVRQVCRYFDNVILINLLHITTKIPPYVTEAFTIRFLLEQMRCDEFSRTQLETIVSQLWTVPRINDDIRAQITVPRCQEAISIALTVHNGRHWVLENLRSRKNGTTPCYVLEGDFWTVLVAWLNLDQDIFVWDSDSHHCLGSAMYAAAYNDDERLAEYLLTRGSKCTKQEGVYGDAFQLAAYRGSVKVLNVWLNADMVCGRRCRRYGRYGSPILAASAAGHLDAVWLLLYWKHDGTILNKNLRSALHLAAMNGHTKVVTHLLRNKALIDNPNKVDRMGYTPLALAVKRGHEEVVKVLLKSGDVSPNKGENGQLPLQIAARSGLVEMARLLLSRPSINMNESPEQIPPPILLAYMNQREDVMELLLQQRRLKFENLFCDDVIQGRRISMEQLRVSMLQWAALKGKMKIAKLLLERHKADPNGRNSERGNTPLHLATAWNQEEMVDLLLEQPGINPNLQNATGETALMLAIKYRSTGIFKRFLLGPGLVDCRIFPSVQAVWRKLSDRTPRDINVRLRRNDGRTALHVAMTRGSLEVVDLLLRRDDVSPNVLDNEKASPLHWAVAAGRVLLVQTLLSHSAIDPNSYTSHLLTPFYVAVQLRNIEMIQALMGHPETDLNCRCERDGTTPLMLAVRSGKTEVLSLLLSSDMLHKDAQDHKGATALLHAAANCCLIAVELLLLERPAVNVNLARKDGTTPLMVAAGEGCLEIATLLLDNGADPNMHAGGRTALFTAAFYGRESMVQLLLGYLGEDANCADDAGRTPVLAAASNGYDNIVDILLRHLSGDLQRADEKGSTPLIEAARNGHERVVCLLLSHCDANPNMADCSGETALGAAVINNHEGIVRILVGRTKRLGDTPRRSRRLRRELVRKGYHDIVRLLR